MQQTSISFKCQGLDLEGVIAMPEGLAPPFPGTVVCHGHPALGGNMENSLIMALVRALEAQGIASFRFNFRGVGESQGTFSMGKEEPKDLKAALALFRAWPGISAGRVALVGYSFGAQVILQGLRGLKRAKALVLVSPPLPAFEGSPIGSDRRPKLFLVGERDRLARAQAIQEQVSAFSSPGMLETFPVADHSWRGREGEMAQRVARYLAEVL